MPDFFLVGAPKCGTTALDAYLASHPDVFMARPKELHFFATDFTYSNKYPRPDEAYYFSRFEAAAPNQVAGESSVFYLYSRAAAANIRAVAPRSRILVMLREPAEMLHALHSQYVYTSDEVIADFRGALAAEPSRRASRQAEPHMGFAEMVYYREIARYAEQLQRYYDGFGRENVHVIFYDDFTRDTAASVRGVLRFLGVHDAVPAALDVVNPNKRLRSRRLGHLMSTRVRDVSPAARRVVRAVVPTRLRHRLFALLTRMNTVVAARPALDRDLREALRREFRPEVERLSAMTGRDLSAWLPHAG